MQKLQLYIDNNPDPDIITYIRIDLFKDETVSISQSIQNIKDPAQVFVPFTKSFTIPASKENNKLFSHYYNFDITNGYDARRKTPAKIELNNIAFKTGFIRLEGVELQNNSPYAYKIVFYGETVGLKDLLGDTKLQALVDLDQYNLEYNSATVKARLQTASGPILCPLITSGASNKDSDLVPPPSRLYYDSVTNTQANGNLYYVANDDNGVLYSDLKYALRVKEIIDAITAQYPTLIFSDDFFNTTNTEFYNLHLWLHRKKGGVLDESLVQTFPSPVTGFGPPTIQATNMFNGTGLVIQSQWLNPNGDLVSGIPNTLQRLFLTTSSNDLFTVVIYRDGQVRSTIANLQGSGAGNTTFQINQGQLGGTFDAAIYTITIFSSVQIIFSEIKWDLGGFDYNVSYGWVEDYTVAFTATASFTFDITSQIPDIKIIDFLTTLFRLFNLTAYLDDNALLVNGSSNPNFGKIRVQRLDDFYTTNVATYDISKYVDVKNSQVNIALPYREIEFVYEGTDTLLAQQYSQTNGRSWGAEQYTGSSAIGDSFDGPNSTYTIKAPFEHLLYERLTNTGAGVAANTQTTAQYGYFVDENQDPILGKPLLFYPVHQPAGSDTTVISFKSAPTGSNINSALTNYFIPSNSVGLDPTNATDIKNLNFREEFNEYTGSTGFSKTLFAENYDTYITNIFNGKTRLTKIKAFLPLNIIYGLKLNDTLVINQQSYKINTIETNLITGESDIELLNNFTQTSLGLIDVFESTSSPVFFTYYYSLSIGAASNLIVGSILFSDPTLSTTLPADTYYQYGSSSLRTYCTDTAKVASFVVNSSGVITTINACGLP